MLTDIIAGVAINLIAGMAWNVIDKTPPIHPIAYMQPITRYTYTPTKTTIWSTE
jgi:hypothetical protein